MSITVTNANVVGYYTEWNSKTKESPSTLKHPDYDKYHQIWTLQEDSFGGEVPIKAKGTCYLPLPSGKAAQWKTDSEAVKTYYYRYLYRADFPELLEEAVLAMTGMIFQDAGVVELPPKMEYLRKDATPAGDSLAMVLRGIAQGQLTMGRAFWLWTVDAATNNLKLVKYDGAYVLNWLTDDKGVLNAVILDESGNMFMDGKWEWKEQYRLCAIDSAGWYYNVVAEDAKSLEFDYASPPAAMSPTYENIRGKKYKGLPGVMFNSVDLEPEPSLPITLPITESALKAYMNSADHEQGLHLTAQPTFYGINVKLGKGQSLNIGSSVMLNVNNDIQPPSVGFLEIEGTGLQMLHDTMKDHKATGRRQIELIESGTESGVALNTRLAIKTASLQNVALTLMQGTLQLLEHAADWMSVAYDDETLKVMVNTDFRKDSLTAQELVYLATLVQQGVMTKEDFYQTLKKAGRTMYETFDEWLEQVEAEGLLSTVTVPEETEDGDGEPPEDKKDGEEDED